MDGWIFSFFKRYLKNEILYGGEGEGEERKLNKK